MVAAAVGIGTAVAGAYGANKAESAAKDAARQQVGAEQAGIDESRRQFNVIQQLFKPYIRAGRQGVTSMQALSGALGDMRQQKQIDSIKNSAQFGELAQQGENAILQNASATGGLRGGNTQAALAQFRPALLSNLINQQYERYAGLAQLGQSSAAGVGSGALQTGSNIANRLSNQGAALAGATLNRANYVAPVAQGLGAYLGMGGTFGGGGGGGGSSGGGGGGTYYLPTNANQVSWGEF